MATIRVACIEVEQSSRGGPGGCMAGESAQREYERLRHGRRERIRGSWPRITLVVAVAFAAGLLVPIALISVAMSMIESAAAGGSLSVRLHVPSASLSLLTGFMFAFGAAASLLAPTRAEISWGRGAGGERIVGAALDALAAEGLVVVLHDRRMPRSRANIDHLAVASGGVFTVDAKRYSGRLQVRAGGRELWIAGRNRSKLLEQAQRQSAAASKVLSAAGIHGVQVTPVLCFVETQMSRLFPPTQVGAVRLTTPRKLHTVLANRDVAVDDELRSRIVDVLDQALPPAGEGERRNTRTSGQATAGTESKSVVRPTSDGRSSSSRQACPRCGESMVVRKRHSDGARFLGCSGFPRCRNTLPFPGPTN